LVRTIVAIFSLSLLLFGGVVDDKVKSFVGIKKYEKSKKIIDILLGNKSRYLKDGRVDAVTLLENLKKNGFINLTLKRPMPITITFETKGRAILFLKILNTALNSMGFNFYTTKKALKDGEKFSWTISMMSEYLLDPVAFSNELKKFGCRVTDIEKLSPTKWDYNISMQDAKLRAKEILSDGVYKLKKPIKPYWLMMGDDASRLMITSYSLNRWHPFIVFFDKKLNILSIYKDGDKREKVSVDIPEKTKYILIDDEFTLTNIRIGLKIYAK